MTLWLILFLLIVGISFILALQSMKDYQELPKKATVEYGLFLIRNTDNFNVEFLNSLRSKEGFIISLERLFKGNQTALTIFGPKKIIEEYSAGLNLLELEDYTAFLDNNMLSVWEIGVKNNKLLNIPNLNNIFDNLPKLRPDEQFFWQVLLKKEENLSFQTQIRAVIFSSDSQRRKMLADDLQQIGMGELTKIPRPFSPLQMMAFYSSRSFSKDTKGPVLNGEGVRSLVLLRSPQFHHHYLHSKR